jgi:hypothetical protein
MLHDHDYNAARKTLVDAGSKTAHKSHDKHTQGKGPPEEHGKTASMPANLTIYLVRHAEKPPSGSGLSAAGEARANAYVKYFQNVTDPSGKTMKWDYLFASAESTHSDRPFLTIQPLAQAIGKTIDPDYKDKHFSKLVKFIQENRKKQFDDSNILICWHHGEILDLAQSLGAECNNLPQSSNWPLSWPGKVFGWLLKIYYRSDGTLQHKQTQAINEKLMPDDIIDPVYEK